MPDPWTRIRSRLASAVRAGEPPEIIEGLRRDLRAARAEVYLRDLMATAPPLTETQRAALAGILAAGGDRDGS